MKEAENNIGWTTWFTLTCSLQEEDEVFCDTRMQRLYNQENLRSHAFELENWCVLNHKHETNWRGNKPLNIQILNA